MIRRLPALLLGLGLLHPIPTALGQPEGPGGDLYADYETLLTRYVRDGEVDYARWKSDAPPAWDRFLAWLKMTDPRDWPLADRRAFWINAYNASVVDGVLRRYPMDSVRDVGLLGGRLRGFFDRREHPVAGRMRTLDEIEKEILLEPPLGDAAVHWGLTCGSRGCPVLRTEPYRGGALERQLEFQAATYLNGPTGHRIDPETRTVYLSRIFDWYREDFEQAAGSVRAYAMRYLTGTALEALRAGWDIEFMDYDWRLNDAAGR
ncbi:MAG: DUF547 domain-containing protein [Gemmatimonadota bacterium]